MFFTLNGKLLGRPTQGLFHMRQADVRAVQELSVRSAGFYDGTAATMLRGSRMQLLCGETGVPGVVTFVLNARISKHARSHDAGARRRIRNCVGGRTVCHEVQLRGAVHVGGTRSRGSREEAPRRCAWEGR